MTRPYYYMGGGRGLTTLSTGEIFFVDTYGHDLSVWILMGGVWETFVDDILCALVRPGDTVLDVGANMGYYSVKMASRIGDQGHLYSFEPNPRLQGFIRDSLNINGFWTRGTVIKAAAGAAPGQSTLTFDPGMPGGGTVGLDASYATPGLNRIEVPVVRIDDAVPADCVAHLIKIDVEGFEPLVIAGMKALMARSPDAAVVTEVAHAHWAQHGEPASILLDLAGDRRIFRIYVDGSIEEIATADLGKALDMIGVSYFLLLPRNEARWAQVSRFVRGRPAEATPAAEAASPAEPVRATVATPVVDTPSATPGAPRSLTARIRRRLAALIAP